MSRSTQGATLLGLVAILFWSTSVGVTRSTIEFLGRTGAPAVLFTLSALLLLPMNASSSPALGPARILVVGGGGRENALAWALARSHGVEAVWVAPGNGGTAELAGVTQLAIAESDQPGLLQACRDHAIELVVVGPEAPLAAGLADHLRAAGFAVFGPGADGALLEASKHWAKALMQEAGVPTAGYWQATSREDALAVLEQQGRPLVVKADGLAAGKGVTVAESLDEARSAVEEIFEGRFGAGEGAAVVLEERTFGPEVSALCAFCQRSIASASWAWTASGASIAASITTSPAFSKTRVISRPQPTSRCFFASISAGAERRCIPICTTCFDARTALIIRSLCSRLCDSGFSR